MNFSGKIGYLLSSTGIWDWLISDYYNIIAAGNGQPGYSIPCLEQLSHIAPSRLPSSPSVMVEMMLKALVLNPVNKHWLKSCVLSEWILLHSIAKWFELWPSQISNCCLLLNMIILCVLPGKSATGSIFSVESGFEYASTFLSCSDN